MTNAVIETIDECLENTQNMTPANMENLVREMLRFFDSLKDKLASPDAKVREDALAEALSLKESLESRAASLMSSINLDSQSIEALLSSANLDPEQMNTMMQAKEDLESYRNELTEQNKALSPKKAKIRKPKLYKTQA